MSPEGIKDDSLDRDYKENLELYLLNKFNSNCGYSIPAQIVKINFHARKVLTKMQQHN